MVSKTPFLIKDIFPEAPSNWLELEGEIEIRFQLLEGQGVNESSFQELGVQTISQAIKHLANPEAKELGLYYVIKLLNEEISFTHFLEWPLKKRTGKPFIQEWDSMRRRNLWEPELNEKRPPLLVLRVDRKSVYGPSVTRLNVSGYSEVDAFDNWLDCVKPLRKLYKSYESDFLRYDEDDYNADAMVNEDRDYWEKTSVDDLAKVAGKLIKLGKKPDKPKS